MLILSRPSIPAPADDPHAANKEYVDLAVAGGIVRPTAAIRGSAHITIPTSTSGWDSDGYCTLDLSDVLWDSGTDPAQYSRVQRSGRWETRLYCRQTGVYLITAGIRFVYHATGQRKVQITLRDDNNTADNTKGIVESAFNPMDPNIEPVATQYLLEAGQYIVLRAWQNSGGNLNVMRSGLISPELRMTRIA